MRENPVFSVKKAQKRGKIRAFRTKTPETGLCKTESESRPLAPAHPAPRPAGQLR
ncbi:hypothetical protein OPIT5_04170 [Opitutaceae bacterium TAV5]|nr:hypothetical protein OPIT5_04170 [Opitutaceae bacterium TAV5]